MKGNEGRRTKRGFTLYRCVPVSLWTRIVSAASAKVISLRWLLSAWGRLLLILQDSDQTASPNLPCHAPMRLPDTEPKWLYLPRVHTSFHNFSYVCVVWHGYACLYVCGVHMHIHAWGPMVNVWNLPESRFHGIQWGRLSQINPELTKMSSHAHLLTLCKPTLQVSCYTHLACM